MYFSLAALVVVEDEWDRGKQLAEEGDTQFSIEL